MKKVKILLIYLIILLAPFCVFAYEKVIPGGETIGIEVHSKGVLVVGFYKVNDKFIGKNSGFRIGDIITKVNHKDVYSISDMMNEINSYQTSRVEFTVNRKDKTKEITMDLINDDSVLKTGLYVKDKINGLGTLSFILEDKKFGGLGHEIVESNTMEKFEISRGEIYDASVKDIIKSYNGSAGEKNATYDRSTITGTITENDTTGIYGIYNKDIDDKEFINITTPDEIRLGDAKIRTVISNQEVKDYDIRIIHIDKSNKTKNILFEITDKELLDKTGGVVQGMSGSPILQDNNMIGVVNYVIVNDTSKGYAIFVTSMLDEIE